MTGAAALALAPLSTLRRRREPADSLEAILARVIELGEGEIGKPYSGPIIGQPETWRYGNPGYDCSSFVAEMQRRATGLRLFSWAYTDTLANESRELKISEVLPGDIVNWRYNDPKQPDTRYPHTGLVYDLAQRKTLDCRLSSGANVDIRPFLEQEAHFFRHPALERLAGDRVLDSALIARVTECTREDVESNWPGIEAALRERGILSKSVAAVAAATTAIETDHTFRPIPEYPNDNWPNYHGGAAYHGRGYIQLTHDYNYRDAARDLGIPELLSDLDLALEPRNAARILAWFFAVKGVAAAAERGDWPATRQIVLGRLGSTYDAYKRYVDALL